MPDRADRSKYDAFGDPLPPRASEKKIAANRANAQHSTGPTSEVGKSHSILNSLKHGLYARQVVLPGEDVAAFDTLLNNMMEELKPQGHAEQGMVRRAADIWWRLGRTASIEAGFLCPDLSRDPRAEWMSSGAGQLVDGFRMVLDNTKTLDQLGRYEARLERALKRTFDLLFQMQAQRRRLRVPEGGPEGGPEGVPEGVPEGAVGGDEKTGY